MPTHQGNSLFLLTLFIHSLYWLLLQNLLFPSYRVKPGLSSIRSSPSRSSVTNRPQNTWRAQGGSSRIHDLLMEIQLTKASSCWH